jgi:predicted transposase YbfD/YdcC
METLPKPPSVSEPRSALELLVERFGDCPDFRCGNENQLHLLVDVIVSAICAVIGGANSWLAVARFVACHETWFRTFLALPEGVPSHDTYRRIFMLLDPKELNQRFAKWMEAIAQCLNLKQVAIDGKTLCGSGGGNTGLTALHMVHAFATENGICLAQQAVDTKSNEITAIPELLKLLDLKGAVVTIDAIGCQKEIAADIVDREADYVLAVKGNQERLYDDVQATLAEAVEGEVLPDETTHAQTCEDNRGRVEKRTCYVTSDVSMIRDKQLWKGLKAVGVIISEREVNGKIEVERRYFISSRVLAAHEMLKVVRNHWKVENQLHWVLDVVFGEDAHQLYAGHGPKNFTTLRKLAHALIKRRDPKHGIKGTREMAGWNLAVLEEIIQEATFPLENKSA